jgi:hypothetical protein
MDSTPKSLKDSYERLKHLPPFLRESLIKTALEEASHKIKVQQRQDLYIRYQDDPILFCSEELGVTFTEDVKQLLYSVRDNPVTIARSANAVGKTHAAAHAAIWFYKCFPGAQVYTTAAPPLENLRRLLWGEINSCVEKSKDGIFKYDHVKNLEIRQNAKSFITGVAIPQSGSSEEREAKFSGKHAPYLFFIVDEADAVPEEVFRGIESCMSGGMVRLLMMFNPRGKAGPVYIKERDNLAKVVQLSAFTHPNVVQNKNLIPGAVDRQKTVERINKWCRPLVEGEKASEMTFLLPDFLVGATALSSNGTVYPPLKSGIYRIEDPAFFYMVLGEYPAMSERQLISDEWLTRARRNWDAYVMENGLIPPPMKPKMGLDVAEYGPDDNIAYFRYGSYVAKPVNWNGIDVDATALRAYQLYHEFNCEIAYIDANGYGANVAPRMVRKDRFERPYALDRIKAVPVKASEKPSLMIKTEMGQFRWIRDQLYWALREWLRTDENAMLPPDELLLQELRTPKYEVKNDGNIHITDKETLRELLRRSPDRMEALALTFAPYERARVVVVDME